MAENTATPAPEGQHVTVDGSSAANIDMTMKEAAATAPVDGPTAEKLGVSDEQFAKYYSAEKGAYNWEAHAREQAYQAQQAAAKDDTKPAEEAKSAEDVEQTPDLSGLDWNSMGMSIAQEGKISEEQKAAVLAAGIPETVVDEYVTLVKRDVDRHVADVHNAFGGEQNYNAARAYAEENMSEAELNVLTSQLADPAQFAVAAGKMMARAGMTGAPAVPNAPGGAGSEVKGFSSQAEQITAQRDPRYRSDPNYRAEVIAKIAASTYGDNPRAHHI